ncbi:MAG: PAS domain S-box protein [Candidatus Aminicenantaceae bacterium]
MSLITQDKRCAVKSGSVVPDPFNNKNNSKESLEMLHWLINYSPDVIFTIDLNGNFLSVNRFTEKLTGIPLSELLKGSLWKFVAPEYHKYLKKLLAQVYDKKRIPPFEVEVITSDKKRITLEVHTNKIKDKGNNIVAVCGIARDITNRKKAEKDKIENLSVLDTAIESTTEGIIITDLEQNITVFNRRSIELWRIPKEFLNSKNNHKAKTFVFSQLNDPNWFKNKIREMYNAPLAESFEELHLKDGRVFICISKPQIVHGKPAGRVWSFRDITESKQTMKKLHNAYEEAESAKKKLKAIIDNAPNLAIQGYNSKGEVIFWNQASSTLYGVSEEQVIGKGLGGIILSESAEKKHKRLIKKVLTLGKPVSLKEWKTFNERGNDRFILSSLFPVFLPGQEPIAVCMDVDMTERKKVEGRIEEKTQQIEKFAEITADILSIEDEKELFERISRAVVDISDFNRALISYFKEDPPYREIIGYQGIKKTDLERVKNIEMPQEKYLNYFEKCIKVGNQSCYIPHYLKHILDQDAVIYGEKSYPKKKGCWHREDNLLVSMKDSKGQLIGIISVDDSKSGSIPTDEMVRPLEIFANLISELIQRRILARKIRESEEKYRELVSNVKVGIFRATPEGKLLEVNPTGVEMFGYGDSMKFLSLNGDDLYKTPEDRTKYVREMEENGIVKNKELSLKRKDGTTFWASLTSTAIKNSRGKIIYHDTVIEDITKKKRLEEKVKRLSITDELTGLYNRRYFNQNLPKEIKRAERWKSCLSFIMIDIDNFKDYNDLYHHLKGDEILKVIAQVISQNIREDVDWASRFGGEEFAIILPGISSYEAYIVAERVRNIFQNFRFKPERKIVYKTISSGVSQCFSRERENQKIYGNRIIKLNYEKVATELTSLADQAMFQAKRMGKNRVVISEKAIEFPPFLLK